LAVAVSRCLDCLDCLDCLSSPSLLLGALASLCLSTSPALFAFAEASHREGKSKEIAGKEKEAQGTEAREDREAQRGARHRDDRERQRGTERGGEGGTWKERGRVAMAEKASNEEDEATVRSNEEDQQATDGEQRGGRRVDT
jgi:hypothetical protein